MKLNMGLVETVGKLGESEVLMIHHKLHEAFAQWKSGEFVTDGYVWTKEDFYNTHKLLVERLKELGLDHGIKDELDRLTLGRVEDTKKMEESSNEEITLTKALELLLPFNVSGSLSLTGEIVTKGRTKGNIDIVVKGPEGNINELMGKYASRVVLHTAQPDGSYIPVYSSNYISESPNPMFMVSDKGITRPGKYFKPKEVSTVLYGLSSLAGQLLKFPVSVQRLSKGVRVQVHKVDGEVFVIMDNGMDVSRRLPCFTGMLKAKDVKEIMLEGIIVSKDPEMRVEGFLRGASTLVKGEDLKYQVQLTDVHWWDENLSSMVFNERISRVERQFEGYPCCMAGWTTYIDDELTLERYLMKETRPVLIREIEGKGYFVYSNTLEFVGMVVKELGNNEYYVGLGGDARIDTPKEDVFDGVFVFIGKVNSGLKLAVGDGVELTARRVYQYGEKVRMVGLSVGRVCKDEVDRLKSILESARKIPGMYFKMNDTVERVYQYRVNNGVLTVDGENGSEDIEGVAQLSEQGIVEWGAQLEDYKEFWLEGYPQMFEMKKLDGKWVTKSTEDRPLVLKKSEYIPQMGISALPQRVKDTIPKEYRYWEFENKDKRMEIRDKYVYALDTIFTVVSKYDKRSYLVERFGKHYFAVTSKEDAKQLSFLEISHLEKVGCEVREFVLSYHWWKESTKHWDLFIEDNMMVLTEDPVGKSEGAIRKPYAKDFSQRGKEGPEFLPPGSPGNKTKDMMSWTERKDSGKVIVLDDTPLCKRYNFLGGVLQGTYEAVRSSPEVNYWKWSKVEVSKLSLEKGEQIVKSRMMMSVSKFGKGPDGLFHVGGAAFSYGVWNGEWFSPEVVRDRPERMMGISVCVGPHYLEDMDGSVASVNFVNDTIMIDTVITNVDKQKEIEEGTYVGFSVEIEVLVDSVRSIIKKILKYDRVNIVANPACEVCRIDNIA
jgi:hypothetical protein